LDLDVTIHKRVKSKTLICSGKKMGKNLFIFCVLKFFLKKLMIFKCVIFAFHLVFISFFIINGLFCFCGRYVGLIIQHFIFLNKIIHCTSLICFGDIFSLVNLCVITFEVCIASTISFVIFARHLFAWIYFIISLGLEEQHLCEKWKGQVKTKI
jgi:hypothetical protein